MGHFERQADQLAHELGNLEEIEAIVEREWSRAREDLADQLANGELIKADNRVVLAFGDVNDRLWSLYPEQGEAALALCARSPELGGKHVQRLMFDLALELVDAYADAFKNDLGAFYHD